MAECGRGGSGGGRLLRSWIQAGVLLLAACAAGAETVVLEAVERGSFREDGFHELGAATAYAVGRSAGGEVRSVFVFDASGLEGAAASATLRVWSPADGGPYRAHRRVRGERRSGCARMEALGASRPSRARAPERELLGSRHGSLALEGFAPLGRGASRCRARDADGDGDRDLGCRFPFEALGGPGPVSRRFCLVGAAVDGSPLRGCARVNVLDLPRATVR